MVEALCYKPKGRRFDPDDFFFFILSNSSSPTMALESTQPLTEMNTGAQG
jgi:hypothetical protein